MLKKENNFIWPSSEMDFWHISNEETSVRIKWSGDLVADYRKLAYQFF